MPADDAAPPEFASPSRRWSWKLPALAALVAALLAAAWFARDAISLAALAEREAELRRFQEEHPLATLCAAFGIYVLVTGASLPGATGMTLALGWLLGFWRAAPLVSFASTAGATLAFLSSRYLLRDWVRARFGSRLAVIEREFARDGAWYLFTLRLVPAAPFFVVNLAMGLTPLRASTFWRVSQMGMLPATCLFVYAGASAPSLAVLAQTGVQGVLTPQLVIALALLGFGPLAIKKLVKARGRPK